MNLILIAAVSDNNVIGLNGSIPWNIPEDLVRFKKLTIGHPVIMGRTTYEFLPPRFRPLPQRKNVIISSTMKPIEGIYVARNIDEALELTAKENPYVIGGQKVYESFLLYTNRLEITRVHRDFRGDTFFPIVNWDEWNLVDRENGVSRNDDIPYSFLTYERR